ncbi:MAG: class II glutamine amidotransferase [Methanobacteriota archaeon]
MCRLFGALSVKPSRYVSFLIGDPCSLLAQSNAAKEKPQADGWGFAAPSDTLFWVRSTGAAYRERPAFESVARGLESSVGLAHLRRASNPMNLTKAKLRVPENVQPFCAHGWAFVHNGQVNDSAGAKKALGKYAKLVQGTNDSELYFWHFIRAFEEKGDVAQALELVEKRLEDGCTLKEGPFTSLNIVLARENELYAWCRYSTQPKKRPYSLCMGDQGYYTMCYLPGKTKLVVMSEKSRKGSWRVMGNGDLLSARKSGKGIAWKVEKLV